MALAAVGVAYVAVSIAASGTGGSEWLTPSRSIPLVVAVGALLVWWTRRRRGERVIDPATLSGPWSGTALAVGFTSTWSFGVTLVVVSQQLQDVRGLGPSAAGVTFLAFSGAFALAGTFNGRLVRRSGVRTVMAAAMALCTVGLVMCALIPASAALAWVVVALLLGGLGQGMAFDASTTASLQGIPERVAGEATGATQTLRLLGSVLGIAISAGVTAAARSGGESSTAEGLRRALLVAAAIAVAGLVMAATGVADRRRSRLATADPRPVATTPGGGSGGRIGDR